MIRGVSPSYSNNKYIIYNVNVADRSKILHIGWQNKNLIGEHHLKSQCNKEVFSTFMNNNDDYIIINIFKTIGSTLNVIWILFINEIRLNA